MQSAAVVSLYGLSAAFALRIWTSVSIGVPTIPGLADTLPGFPDFIGYGRASSGLDGNDSDPQTIVLQALWCVLGTVGIASWRRERNWGRTFSAQTSVPQPGKTAVVPGKSAAKCVLRPLRSLKCGVKSPGDCTIQPQQRA